MSDSVTKWHEMNEESKEPMIFESPDNGKTVTQRPFGSPISERTPVRTDLKKEAYTILSLYNEDAIKYAYEVLSRD